jgi:predicted ABC-type ATPase
MTKTMSQVWNIRGTNGSGKSTLVRHWTEGHTDRIVLSNYPSPTKADPGRYGYVEGYHRVGLAITIIVGPYEAPTGGMDKLPSFEVCRQAISQACRMAPHVLCEGVLASTVFGSWAEYAARLAEHGVTFNWVYLQTPLEVCFERIKARQEDSGRVRGVKANQVADKVRAVAATRTKALAAGFPVWDLPFMREEAALIDMIGEKYRVQA